jgi:hypothetical protein
MTSIIIVRKKIAFHIYIESTIVVSQNGIYMKVYDVIAFHGKIMLMK